jgi:hypothetical protein
MEDENVIKEEVVKKESNETLEKLLREKRNWQTKALELEDALKKESEKKLVEKEEWKALSEKYGKEKTELETKYASLHKEIINGKKQSAIKNELLKIGADTKALPALLRLAELDKVRYDEDHGIVLDAETVALSVKDIIPQAFGVSMKVDHSAPQTSAPLKMSIDTYKTLSYDDQKKKMKDLYESLGVTVR